MRRPTMKEVAERAGVSVATVSRLLNGQARVRSETRMKILEAMRELNYEPRGFAALESQVRRIGLLLVLATESLQSDAFFVRLIDGINDELDARRARLLVATFTQEEALDIQALAKEARDVDGVILGGAIRQDPKFDPSLAFNVPVVVFDRYVHEKVSSVIVDNVEAGKSVVKHLGALGHRRIGVVAGPEDIPAVNDKLAGYALGLRELGIRYDETVVFRSQRYHSWEAGYEGGRHLLSLKDRPTAIAATDDMIAFGIMRAAEEIGLRVPEDLALVGYGDVLYDQTGIPMTSVAVNFEYFGRLVARLLLDVIMGYVTPPVQLSLHPTLVVRRTCGAQA